MRFLAATSFVLLALFLAGSSAGGEKKANPAATPTKKGGGWVTRHQSFVDIAKKGDVDLLLMGDSITDFWRSKGQKIYDKNLAPLKTANFGISADRTQNVLWRLENGELDGITPKVVMLMIGTNNTNPMDGDTKDQIVEGIDAIVKTIHKKSPTSKVLLLAIFPREDKVKSTPETRTMIVEINKTIAKWDDGGKTLKYLDINSKFLKDGKLPTELFPDSLHPNEAGYQIWLDAVMPTIQEMFSVKGAKKS